VARVAPLAPIQEPMPGAGRGSPQGVEARRWPLHVREPCGSPLRAPHAPGAGPRDAGGAGPRATWDGPAWCPRPRSPL